MTTIQKRVVTAKDNSAINLAKLQAKQAKPVLQTAKTSEAKPVSAKPVLQTAKTSEAKPKDQTFSAIEAQEQFKTVLNSRIAKYAHNANMQKNLTVELKAFSSVNALAMLDTCHCKLDIDLHDIAKKIAIPETDKENYVAIYALQKVRKALFALATGLKSGFDGYSFSIVSNIVNLQKLDNKNALSCICKKIEFTDFDLQQHVERLHNCVESTARTQTSSTRMMLKTIGLCNIVKGKTNDVITLSDGRAVDALVAMFVK